MLTIINYENHILTLNILHLSFIFLVIGLLQNIATLNIFIGTSEYVI